MIGILILILAAIMLVASVVGVWRMVLDPIMNDHWSEKIMNSGLGLLLTLLVTAMVTFCAAGVYAAFEFGLRTTTDNIIQRIELISLGGETQTEGAFILGSGMINGEAYYVYYRVTGSNRYERGQVKATRVVVSEEANVNPNMTWMRKYYTLPKWVGKPIWDDYKDEEIVLHVPTNTIVRKFQL